MVGWWVSARKKPLHALQQLQGLTGLSQIQIGGGAVDQQHPLAPVIFSGQSGLVELVTGGCVLPQPALIAQLVEPGKAPALQNIDHQGAENDPHHPQADGGIEPQRPLKSQGGQKRSPGQHSQIVAQPYIPVDHTILSLKNARCLHWQNSGLLF